jgi:hypothetical protein
LHQPPLRGRIALERAVSRVNLRHPDVRRVADLSIAIHRGFHGTSRRRIGIDRNRVLAAERLLADLHHGSGDFIAVGIDAGRGPPDRLAVLRLGRLEGRHDERGRHHRCGYRKSENKCFLHHRNPPLSGAPPVLASAHSL